MVNEKPRLYYVVKSTVVYRKIRFVLKLIDKRKDISTVLTVWEISFEACETSNPREIHCVFFRVISEL